MNKHYSVIFQKPVILPCNMRERVTAYGLYLPKSCRTTVANIQAFLIYYLKVLDLLFSDENIEMCNRCFSKRNGISFSINDDTWDEYANKAEKERIKFAVLETDAVEIKEDDLFNILLTNKEKWEQMQARNDIIWY